MPLSRTILLSVAALLVGGLIGARVASVNMGKGERNKEALRTYATTLLIGDQIDLMNRSEFEKAKTNLNHQLAIYAMKAEYIAKTDDDAGFIAKRALNMVADYRSSPAYLQEEKAVKLLLATPIDPIIAR